jgi:hypothetical protein
VARATVIQVVLLKIGTIKKLVIFINMLRSIPYPLSLIPFTVLLHYLLRLTFADLYFYRSGAVDMDITLGECNRNTCIAKAPLNGVRLVCFDK